MLLGDEKMIQLRQNKKGKCSYCKNGIATVRIGDNWICDDCISEIE